MLRYLRVPLLAVTAAILVVLSARDASAQACTAAIGDLVWLDQNQNGLRDASESGLGISGVVLELRDSAGALVATTTTAPATGGIPGLYLFGFLCPGTYTVSIVGGVPPGYSPTVSPDGADPTRDSSTSPVTVTISAPDQKDHAVDFGFVTGCSGSIGDRVWADVNENGVQDAGEAGIPGVTVRLLRDGAPFSTTTTDANGNYTFSGLCPGNFTVEVDTPAGFAASPTGAADAANDSDASGVLVSLGLNQNNATIDFGFFAPCTGTIGDRVWFDTNRNGIQDAGELGIAGVSVGLIDSTGLVVATTVTDGDGNYQFTGICGGSYTVNVVTATLPAGVVPTQTGQGTAATDSNDSPAAVTLSTGHASDLTIDFGYNAPCTGEIGDFVWHDVNANGIQDAGELGIPGVRVVLRDRATNTVLAVDFTDGSGFYLFEGLCLGEYIVEVDSATLPAAMAQSPANQGSNDEVDSDGVNDEAIVSLAADDATDMTIDFGYFKSTQIQLVKLTNGTDNNLPTGPSIPVGNAVTWTYRVTNVGSTEPLRNVVVVDDNGTAGTGDDFAPTLSGGDTNGNGLLDIGETWTFVASGAAVLGQYSNLATATAFGSKSDTPVGPVKDRDHYIGVAPPPPPSPGIKIDKTADKTTAVFGETVTFTYVVTNTGNVPLTDVVVTDDNATPTIGSDDFTVGTIASLEPGQSKTFVVKRIPPAKMCNKDWQGKDRKCGLLIVEHWGPNTKFKYYQARDHRDDYGDHDGWSGKRSYSRKAKFRVLYKDNVWSQDNNGQVKELSDNDEYESEFETLALKSNVSFDDDSVMLPKIFHKSNWDSDWRSDWDRRDTWGSSRYGRWDDDRSDRDNDYDYDYTKHPKPCTTTSTNIATVVAKYGDTVVKATDKATVQITAPANQAPYKTFTQGGWGAKPSGNNPGKFLSDKFGQVYPVGFMQIGGVKTLKFTSAYAIEKFLPQGGTPARLTSSLVNPTSQLSVFAGQVLALQLNVDFSIKGFTRAGLANLTVVSGELEGSTVSQVLALANSVLGGGALPSGLSLSELNNIVAKINENFDGGTQNNGYLAE